MHDHDLFVIVPYRDDAQCLLDTLFALAEQTDRHYTLVLVDYGSSDASPSIAERFTRGMRWPRVHRIHRPADDRAAAADLGFRHAITLGARLLARIDPGSMPDPTWVESLERAFAEGPEVVVGTTQRSPGTWTAVLAWISGLLGARRIGATNLATTAAAYREAGARAEPAMRALVESATRVIVRKDVVVYETRRAPTPCRTS